MSPRKRDVDPGWLHTTESGRWSVPVGERPYTVRVREEVAGGRIVLDYRDHSGRRRVVPARTPSVRTKRGALDRARVAAAVKEADLLNAELRAGALREVVEPVRLTVGAAFARFHSDEIGGLPKSRSARMHHDVARRFWLEVLGEDTPWNRIEPTRVIAAAKRLAEMHVQTADKRVRCLKTVHRWLTKRAGIDGLKDPTRGVDFAELWNGYEPRQPRYSRDEMGKLLTVRYAVDPRFSFLLVWADDSGARSKALFTAWRSMVDTPLDLPPSRELAPFGWVALPGMKGQGRALVFLSLRQRLEFARATWRRWSGAAWVPGHLSELERRWREHGTDYPLVPGGRLPRDGIIRTAETTNNGTIDRWLKEAERLAGVPRIARRGWHGIRRSWADFTLSRTDLDTVTAAGAWATRDTPEAIYLAKEKHDRLARSREAQEAK